MHSIALLIDQLIFMQFFQFIAIKDSSTFVQEAMSLAVSCWRWSHTEQTSSFILGCLHNVKLVTFARTSFFVSMEKIR